MIQFKILLPPAPATPNDIVDSKLSVSVGGTSVAVDVSYPVEATESDVFEGDEGQEVVAEFAYVDEVGNRSDKSRFSQTLADTFPPPIPGILGLAAVGETFAPSTPPVEEDTGDADAGKPVNEPGVPPVDAPSEPTGDIPGTDEAPTEMPADPPAGTETPAVSPPTESDEG